MRLRIFGLLLACLSLTAVACSDSKSARIKVDGAGATFPAPLYKKWFENYQAAHPEVKVNYDGLGSGAGIQLFTEQLIDFGASDAAMTDEQMQKVKSGGVQLVPMTSGMVVLAYNLPGVSKLKLSPQTYADIWLGKISSWDDPKIKETNPEATLPAEKITVVHRLGASGTTFVFTKHLSAISDEWKRKYGQGLTVEWPTGAGTKEWTGLFRRFKKHPVRLGIWISAVRSKELTIASLQNKSGEFVEPGLESCQAAFSTATLPADLRLSVPDPDGKESYPIVTFTWILAHAKYTNPKTGAAVKDVLKYCLTDGQKECASLGYIPLSDPIRQTVLEAVNKIGS